MLLVFINAYLQQKATRRILDRDTASLKQNGKSLNDLKDNSCSKRVRSCSKLFKAGSKASKRHSAGSYAESHCQAE